MLGVCLHARNDTGIHIDRDVIVECDVASEGRTDVGVLAEVDGSISSRDRITLEAGAEAAGTLRADRDVTLKKSAVVGGSVLSGDDVVVADGAAVAGNVDAADDIDLHPGATIGGTVTPNSAVPPVIPLAVEDVSATSGTLDVTIPATGSMSLLPGTSRDLVVGQAGSPVLHAGTYHFRTARSRSGRAPTSSERSTADPSTSRRTRRSPVHRRSCRSSRCSWCDHDAPDAGR